uniref:Uncharacterized protein n=1 Tax=Noccaea caerulescens TaxID=107243 RepID=A0A1J3D4R0_NOCCA
MEDEKVLELFRRISGLRPEVAERNNFPYLNKSEEMLLQFHEETPAETEQTNLLFHSLNNPNPPEIHEGIKSSSSSNEDTEDSSSNSDLDSSLSRYYFDGSLPVSTHVEESETHRSR